MSITDLIPGFSWAKATLGIVAFAAAAWGGWTIQHWRSQAHELSDWQSQVIQYVTEATVPPDGGGNQKLIKPSAVIPALRGLAADRDNARQTLEKISADTRAAKARADAADARLATVQKDNQARAAASAKVIAELRVARPTGDAEADQALIDTASRAAWRGWK